MDYTKYCSLTFNGKLLDATIPNYTTLNVEGRVMIGRSIKNIDIPARDGTYVQWHTIKPRTIRVYYAIKATNALDFRKSLDLLHQALSSDQDVRFSFGDESTYRLGRFADYSEPPRDQFQGGGSFDIFCQDPHQYWPQQTFAHTAIPSSLISDSRLISIKATFGEASNILKITNTKTGQSIVLRGSYNAGQVIDFGFVGLPTILSNSISRMPDLDILSDFEDFTVLHGDAITVSPATTKLEVTAQRRGL